MRNNVGPTDKIIRIILSVIFIALYLTDMVPGTVGLVLVAVGSIVLVTSSVNFCPIYTLFGFSSRPKSE